ncbi:LytR/AlgR family response regulator transcription factor [Anaerovorax odorimutans]|uniref:LytR/AlgR family response regulator transcription factor n=1 Tax=Anaerovorax odorimutans TaxID=109327 RepID=UPI0021099021
MFYVAICDDEKAICVEIERFLASYIKDALIQTKIFYSGEKLYKSMEAGEHFDMIFLDIELKLINGVRVAEKIREELSNEKTHIVFISGKQEYAIELFSVRPLHFLVKPFSKKQVIDVLIKAMKLSQIYHEYFEFRIEQSYYKVFYGDVLYFESKARKIIIHMSKGEYEFYGKLNHIEEKTHGNFLRIHQSYLVNPLYIEHYEYDQVLLLDNRSLPISKSFRSTVRNKLLENWENE